MLRMTGRNGFPRRRLRRLLGMTEGKRRLLGMTGGKRRLLGMTDAASPLHLIRPFGAPASPRLRCPKAAAGDKSPLRLFDRGTSSPSLFPPPAAVGLVTLHRGGL